MKRFSFIILGVVLIIILVVVWVYVLFFWGSPDNNPTQFAEFPTSEDTLTDTPNPNEPAITEQPTVDVTSEQQLRQLTTEPVIAYQEVQQNASSSPYVFYVKAGEGYVYSINLDTGEEHRISATTIPLSTNAAITPNGKYVLIQSGEGWGSEFILGALSTSSDTLATRVLGDSIINFTATEENTFLYTTPSATGLAIKHYYPISDTSETIATIPFREATVSWGNTALAAHYVYPKTSSQLEGAVFKVQNGILKRLPIDGYGVSAAGKDDLVVITRREDLGYVSYLYNERTNDEFFLPRPVLPYKCTFLTSAANSIVCASIGGDYKNDSFELWSAGIEQHDDYLWEINTKLANMMVLNRLGIDLNRTIDIDGISGNKSGSRLYFTNRIDQTLWLFARSDF